MEVATTTTTSKNINYKTLKNKAYDFLEKYSNGRLPIDLLRIINQIENLYLMKYTRFAKDRGLEIEQVCDLLQSEDGALWYQTTTNTYILLYNDTVASKERIRFTIAHELGHYVLKHNEITDKTILSRYSLSDKEYNRFETEANFFAKHLLVPFPILENYFSFFKEMSSSFIMKVFQVSKDVSNYVIDNLRKKQEYNISKDVHYVEESFTPYITTTQSTRICKTCHSKINRYSKYCHICAMEQYKGLTTLDAYLENKEMERERMRYFKYPINDAGFPDNCPRCENEDIEEGIYCNVCGLYTQNICLGNYDNNYNDFGYPLPITDFLESGCGKHLAGNSRYCSDCGGKSSYFFQGLLKNWDIEKEEYETVNELPF